MFGRPLRKPNPKTAGARRAGASVSVWSEDLVLPTYLPALPDRHPMFLEKRVYQGSSGRVYPLPVTDRIAEKPILRKWRAVWIENEYLRVLVLPELGGRIHRVLDRTNDYDLVYYQPVIKPALVGLAGPWISGGIEFNWPQHHRPATFLPADVEIEHGEDGSKTIWCGDHEPMTRMKGMHGVCLRSGHASLELKVRVHNRTALAQTFLWWANVATRVHEAYQSFFPPDTQHVADHARRSMSSYPLARHSYYGVNYGLRARRGTPRSEVPAQFVPPHCGTPSDLKARSIPDYAPNDLSFYANIPVPTSYMCIGSREDFFGGYDHLAEAGIVHLANHHIAPGKKQWTWGNHDFGYAWDRNLTEPDAGGVYHPYLEIMAGVYTDNQPDFSFLQPGETRTWSQYWYPIQKIGPVQQANLDAAISLRLDRRQVRLGVAVTRSFPKATVRLERRNGSSAAEWDCHLEPGKPWVLTSPQATRPWRAGETLLRVMDRDGGEIISYRPNPGERREAPAPATEPAAPADISSADELYLLGVHLDQYRHATRCPTLYWREAIRRDPLDARCNNALGVWHLKRGEFGHAETHFRNAVQRLTSRNANPYDSEAFYHLGVCLRHLNQDEAAYDAFYKAAWSRAWLGPTYHALAEIDCCRHHWTIARRHCEQSAHGGEGNNRLINLRAIVLRRCGQFSAANRLLRRHRVDDPLDWWTRHLLGEPLVCDLQTCLDIVHDLARAGFVAEAIKLLKTRMGQPNRTRASGGGHDFPSELPDQSLGAWPLAHYTLGWLYERLARERHSTQGDRQARQAVHPAVRAARKHYGIAAALPPDHCFPARLEEIAVLEAAIRSNRRDSRALYYLGNLLYDRRRHAEAVRLWERSAAVDPTFPVVWRNLGIAYFNVRRDARRARRAYERAFRVDPGVARVLYERDQLWKRIGVLPSRRLRELEHYPHLVKLRDDLTVEVCGLYNQSGQPERALELLNTRRFQPWEGGEGGPLGQWVRSQLALGRTALARGDPATARDHFAAALEAPPNLGEARHLLGNASDVHYWLGCALAELGQLKLARKHWRAAAAFRGDFQEMRVRAFGEMTYYSAMAWGRLDKPAKAKVLLRELLAHARKLATTRATIDYFATSLPAMLLFEDDLQFRQQTTARFLEAEAQWGLGRRAEAKRLLGVVLKRDPNHPLAADFADGHGLSRNITGE